MKDFTDSILKKHDKEGDDVIFVGFSWGGVIACRLSHKMKQSNIVGIITINTPHVFIKDKCQEIIPVASFGPVCDLSDPFSFTRGGRHHTLFWGADFVC